MAPCSICVHKDAARINLLLLNVTGRRTGAVEAIAAQFQLSRQTVWRHRKYHLGLSIPKPRPLATLEERLEDLGRDALRLQRMAEAGAPHASLELALRALRERRTLLEMQGKLEGRLREDAKVVVQTAVNLPAGPTTAEETDRLIREYMEVCGTALPAGEEE